jgi:regulator of PEP synthase PpsR (kinase-PPPase family)
MNLHLVPKADVPKETMNVVVYSSVADELRTVCKAQNIRLSDLFRHLINEFLTEYRDEFGMIKYAPKPDEELVEGSPEENGDSNG